MGHDWFTQFDRGVCEGSHSGVDGPCPLRKTGHAGFLGPLLEGKLLGKLLGISSIDKCGACGCTLAGLDMADAVPTECIRRDEHFGR